MTTIPPDAPRSEDGQWWWDGAQWQPVAGQASDASATQSSAEPSQAELAAVGDTNPEPAQNVPEHLQSAFVDGDPASSGGAEVGPTLDDAQFEQPAAEA